MAPVADITASADGSSVGIEVILTGDASRTEDGMAEPELAQWANGHRLTRCRPSERWNQRFRKGDVLRLVAAVGRYNFSGDGVEHSDRFNFEPMVRRGAAIGWTKIVK